MTNSKTLADAFNGRIDAQVTNFNTAEGGAPRFEFWGAGISICSQKVRCVLLERGASVASHEMNPKPDTFPFNYLPEYVAMRMEGAKAQGLADKLVSQFTGGSSVDDDGFDPCAVPTLADHANNRIVVDSKVICEYLDASIEGDRLIPDDLRDEVQAQVAIVDSTPHVTLLYGDETELDRRPAFLKGFAGPPLELKIKLLKEKIEENKDNPELVRAYESKILKEQIITEIRQRPTNLAETHDRIFAMLNQLESDLSGDKWFFGDRFTMADTFWAINLHRLENMGHGVDMGAKTRAYADRLYDRPSISAGLIEYPNCWFWAPEYFGEAMLNRFNGMRPDAIMS